MKVFQDGWCVDCGSHFITLQPPELVAYGWKHSKGGKTRCDKCRSSYRNANHGGGPRKRCKRFNVPYEPNNPTVIYARDNYKCLLCGGDLDMSAHYRDSKAPSIDHKISLSAPGSPGHVLSNLQSAHLGCNISKSARIDSDYAKSTGFVAPGVEIQIVCAQCGDPVTKTRPNAIYCSKRCKKIARDRRKRRKDVVAPRRKREVDFSLSPKTIRTVRSIHPTISVAKPIPLPRQWWWHQAIW